MPKHVDRKDLLILWSVQDRPDQGLIELNGQVFRRDAKMFQEEAPLKDRHLVAEIRLPYDVAAGATLVEAIQIAEERFQLDLSEINGTAGFEQLNPDEFILHARKLFDVEAN